MSTVITNPSPRTRFQESGDNRIKHRELIALREFERAADFAMLSYQSKLCLEPSDFNTCAGNHLKIRGALEFLQEFRNLAETATAPTVARPIANLDHKA